LVVLVLGLAAPGGALASSGTRVLRYHGYRLVVPTSWPVFDLSTDPSACVRFNRHAVYLGTPGGDQRCPVQAIGRTEAILVAPRSASDNPLPTTSVASADAVGGTVARIVDRRQGVVVTATWNRQPAVIARALGVRSLARLAALSRARPQPSPISSISASGAIAAAGGAAEPGQVFIGRGFDTCEDPNSAQMSAWLASPYRAVGVYIGGSNMGCSQPALSAAWIQRQSAAGWHLIPIYVGLQAPNSCSCGEVTPKKAASQGTGDAADAVAQAKSVGLGTGNPIFFDMEAYTPGGTTTSAVMTFLAAWTSQLHAQGYKSGVYSSASSGIQDLVSRYGTGYLEPDEIWVADWNGVASANDPSLPGGDWSNHQRLHQFLGPTYKTFGGSTNQVDINYLNAITAAAGTTKVTAATPPALTTDPLISGAPIMGQTLRETHGRWSHDPVSYSYQWQDCDSTGTECTSISGAHARSYTLARADVGHTIRVIEDAANAAGSGTPASSAQTGSVERTADSGYWLYNGYGNVYNSLGAHWYGSAAHSQVGFDSIVGMAPTANSKGYWLADAAGNVYPYGNAPTRSNPIPYHPVIGIVRAPRNHYWLYSAYGDVYHGKGTRFYGSPLHSHIHDSTITGMAATPDDKGYWLVDSHGRVYAYGDATSVRTSRKRRRIIGIVAAPGGGYWLYTPAGNVFHAGGAVWYGSPLRRGDRAAKITGMSATPDGKGYWMVDSGGHVYAYGDAANWPSKSLPAILGIAG
jgi:Domain of unknown function (DUF1906)